MAASTSLTHYRFVSYCCVAIQRITGSSLIAVLPFNALQVRLSSLCCHSTHYRFVSHRCVAIQRITGSSLIAVLPFNALQVRLSSLCCHSTHYRFVSRRCVAIQDRCVLCVANTDGQSHWGAICTRNAIVLVEVKVMKNYYNMYLYTNLTIGFVYNWELRNPAGIIRCIYIYIYTLYIIQFVRVGTYTSFVSAPLNAMEIAVMKCIHWWPAVVGPELLCSIYKCWKGDFFVVPHSVCYGHNFSLEEPERSHVYV